MMGELKGVFVLTMFYILGSAAAWTSGAGIPGAVIGLLLVLAAAVAAPGLQEQIRAGALVMLSLVPLFLVPLLTRMPLTLDFAEAGVWLMVIAFSIATVAGILATGFLVKLVVGSARE